MTFQPSFLTVYTSEEGQNVTITKSKDVSFCRTSNNASGIGVAMSSMIDGSSAEVIRFFISHVPAVESIQDTVRIGTSRANAEKFAGKSISIIVYVEDARSLHFVPAANHDTER